MDKILQAIITFVGTGITAFFGLYGIAILILFIASILDIISGYIAAKITGKKNKTTFKNGLLKKILIGMIVAFAGCLDALLCAYTVINAPYVFLFTSFFFIGVEGLSFLKNVQRAGIQLPTFLIKILGMLKDKGNGNDNNKVA